MAVVQLYRRGLFFALAQAFTILTGLLNLLMGIVNREIAKTSR
jgi:hypothetical protein